MPKLPVHFPTCPSCRWPRRYSPGNSLTCNELFALFLSDKFLPAHGQARLRLINTWWLRSHETHMSQHGDLQHDSLPNTDKALPHLLAQRRRGTLSSPTLAHSIILCVDNFIRHRLWHRLRHRSRALLVRRTALRRVRRTRALGEASIYTPIACAQKKPPQAHVVPRNPATASLRRSGNTMPVRPIPIFNRLRVFTDLSPAILPCTTAKTILLGSGRALCGCSGKSCGRWIRGRPFCWSRISQRFSRRSRRRHVLPRRL